MFSETHKKLRALAVQAQKNGNHNQFNKERKQLFAKLQKLCPNWPIKRGSMVIDLDGCCGIVVRIEPGHDIEDHGTVFVWQIDRLEYGADNCEHYCEFGWEKSLVVIEQ